MNYDSHKRVKKVVNMLDKLVSILNILLNLNKHKINEILFILETVKIFIIR